MKWTHQWRLRQNGSYWLPFCRSHVRIPVDFTMVMYMRGGDWLEIGTVVNSRCRFYCCHPEFILGMNLHFDGLMQERRNSSALAVELCLSCINSSILCHIYPRPVFWPSGIVVACICVCVLLCVRVNPELMHKITCHLFELEPPNWDKRCKTRWVRSLLMLRLIDLDPLRQF